MKYPKPCDWTAIGRRGQFTQHGMMINKSVLNEIILQPILKDGSASQTCRVVIPCGSIDEFVKNLEKLK